MSLLFHGHGSFRVKEARYQTQQSRHVCHKPAERDWVDPGGPVWPVLAGPPPK